MNSKIILIAFNLCLIWFWGCADDNETNNDSVFNYNPDYNDPIRTEYTGIYYPMGENFTWNYSGTVDMTQEYEGKINGVTQISNSDSEESNTEVSIII